MSNQWPQFIRELFVMVLIGVAALALLWGWTVVLIWLFIPGPQLTG